MSLKVSLIRNKTTRDLVLNNFKKVIIFHIVLFQFKSMIKRDL